MSSTESEEHMKLRDDLRELRKTFSSFRADQFDYSSLQALKMNVSSMDLDNPEKKPIFFTACRASLLLDPDNEYDRGKRITYPYFESTDPIHRRPIDCAKNLIAYFSSYITANDIGSETKISATSWSSIRYSTPLPPTSVLMIFPKSMHCSVLDFLH